MRIWKQLCGLALLAAVLFAMPVAAGDARRDPAALLKAYPDFLARIESGVLVWKDGTRMALDDGRGKKSLQQMLRDADIDDMFAMAYPKGDAGTPPPFEFDPGRVRNSALFDKMYGNCRSGGLGAELVPVAWLPRHGGGHVMFSPVNGAADQLAKVSAELDKLPAEFMRYLVPSAGTFNCRVIAGTRRLSMHAYAIAIDINLKHTNYWRWAKPGTDGRYPYRNQIPREIVRIFERHGFIWGGKWYHYDTMHFEYRPELVGGGN